MKRHSFGLKEVLQSSVLRVLARRVADRKEGDLTDEELERYKSTEWNLDWDNDVEFMKSPDGSGFNLLN